MDFENNIPPPTVRNWKNTLDAMQINQSMRISIQFYNSVKSAISQHFHIGIQKAFTTAKEPDGFFRVWRVK